MLLAIDIGNTNIKVAVFDGETINHTWRISSDSRRTGDEYFSILRSLFRDAEIKISQFENVILTTVVPTLT